MLATRPIQISTAMKRRLSTLICLSRLLQRSSLKHRCQPASRLIANSKATTPIFTICARPVCRFCLFFCFSAFIFDRIRFDLELVASSTFISFLLGSWVNVVLFSSWLRYRTGVGRCLMIFEGWLPRELMNWIIAGRRMNLAFRNESKEEKWGHDGSLTEPFEVWPQMWQLKNAITLRHRLYTLTPTWPAISSIWKIIHDTVPVLPVIVHVRMENRVLGRFWPR